MENLQFHNTSAKAVQFIWANCEFAVATWEIQCGHMEMHMCACPLHVRVNSAVIAQSDTDSVYTSSDQFIQYVRVRKVKENCLSWNWSLYWFLFLSLLYHFILLFIASLLFPLVIFVSFSSLLSFIHTYTHIFTISQLLLWIWFHPCLCVRVCVCVCVCALLEYRYRQRAFVCVPKSLRNFFKFSISFNCTCRKIFKCHCQTCCMLLRKLCHISLRCPWRSVADNESWKTKFFKLET